MHVFLLMAARFYFLSVVDYGHEEENKLCNSNGVGERSREGKRGERIYDYIVTVLMKNETAWCW